LRRSREDILYGILKACSYDGMSVYQLMVTVNLSHKSLTSCLNELVESKLITIEVEEKKKTVRTTPEGIKVASLYRGFVSSLKMRESGIARNERDNRRTQIVS
jgi:predicted transcriptional regulator